MALKTGHDSFPNRSTFTQRLTDKQEQKVFDTKSEKNKEKKEH